MCKRIVSIICIFFMFQQMLVVYSTEISYMDYAYDSSSFTEITVNGTTTDVSIGGVNSKRIDATRQVAFSVINNSVSVEQRYIRVRFYYYDNGTQTINFRYSIGNGTSKTLYITRRNTNTWKTYEALIEDAVFDNSVYFFPGNFSYAIYSNGVLGTHYAYIGRVEVWAETDISYSFDKGKFEEKIVSGTVTDQRIDFVNSRRIEATKKLAYAVINDSYTQNLKYVKIKLRYYDNGTKSINFNYQSLSGEKTLHIFRSGTNAWKEKEFYIDDASFTNGLSFYGGDHSFSIYSSGTLGTDYAYIGRVEVDYINYHFNTLYFSERFPAGTVSDSSADNVVSRKINSNSFIGYHVINNSFWITDNHIKIRFYYYDNSSSPIYFRYGSITPLTGYSYNQLSITRTNTNEWKVYEAVLEDARFDNGLYQSNMYYSFCFLSDSEIHLGRVEAARTEPIYINPYDIHNINVQQNQSIVTPTVSAKSPVNPGVGYHSLNQLISGNPESKTLYRRFPWKDIEPSDQQFDFTPIDNFIAEAKANGQEAAFRIMPYSRPDYENDSSDYVWSRCEPEWFRQSHSGVVNTFLQYKQIDPAFPQNGAAFGNNDPIWVIDWGSEDFISQQEELIEALGERYNQNPDIAFVDVWGPGNWGEWHNAIGLPLNINQPKRIVDSFLEFFPDMPKVISIQSAVRLETQSLYPDGVNSPYVLQYALQNGMGWRYDGMEYSPVFQIGSLLQGLGMEDCWKNAPVYFEPGSGNVTTRRTIFNENRLEEFEALHITGFHNFNDNIYNEDVTAFYELLSFAGYRLNIKELSAPLEAEVGSLMGIDLTVENSGVNPLYKPYVLGFRLDNGSESYVFESDEDLRTWLPGEHNVYQQISLSPDIVPGEYMLSVAILDNYSRKPKIHLLNQGIDERGWYPMCKIDISEPMNLSSEMYFVVDGLEYAEELVAGKEIYGASRINNIDGNDIEYVRFTLALYGNSNNLENIITTKGQVSKGSDIDLFTETIELPNPLNGEVAKLFLWKEESLQPLHRQIILIRDY